MSGAYCSISELIDLRLKSKNINFFRYKKKFSHLIGDSLTLSKGRGVDFEEVRSYQSGDDVRMIDWRVTARRSKIHTKVYREERERPVFIVLEQSKSLFFGSQLNFKSVTASEIAAIAAWSTMNVGDRIGGLVFNDDTIHEIRSKKSENTLIEFLRLIELQNNSLNMRKVSNLEKNKQAFLNAMIHTKRVVQPGTQIIIISDFLSYQVEAYQYLFKLSKYCQVLAIHISDLLERQLPKPNTYYFSDGLNQFVMNTSSALLKKEYNSSYQNTVNHLQKELSVLKIPMVQIYSHKESYPQLFKYFGNK